MFCTNYFDGFGKNLIIEDFYCSNREKYAIID